MYRKCSKCGSTNTLCRDVVTQELSGKLHCEITCRQCGTVSYGIPYDLRSCVFRDDPSVYDGVENGLYNLSYYEGMLRSYSPTAERIAKIRWDFVFYCPEIGRSLRSVLDYGSGVGWFRAFRPEDIEVDSFDIASYPQTGIRREDYDLVCFWDVLEHIQSFASINHVLSSTRFVAITLPIVPAGVKLADWKHFKPGEHLHYFTEETVELMFRKFGFVLVKQGTPECPPRTDVHSFLFERRTS